MTKVKMHLLRYAADRDSHKKQTWIAFLQRVSGRQRKLSDFSCLLACSVRVNRRPLEMIIRLPCGGYVPLAQNRHKYFGENDQHKSSPKGLTFYG